nr:MAG TPA: hypothetical protein [Caudoviricetes sp.]DAY47188.1 MAG TPA: hypothetical protein [Caudoviricetes sp.]
MRHNCSCAIMLTLPPPNLVTEGRCLNWIHFYRLLLPLRLVWLATSSTNGWTATNSR